MKTRFTLITLCLFGLLSALGDMSAFCQAQKPQLVVETGHPWRFSSVCFSPNGKTLASGSDQVIKLWDTATGKFLRTLIGHEFFVSSVCFSPDGKTLASGGEDGTIRFWDPATGKLLHTIELSPGKTKYDDAVFTVAFSPDGKTLASGGYGKAIKLWDAATGKLLRALTGHTDMILSVAFSPDGKTLASGSGDKTVKLWDPATGQLLRTLTGHTNQIYSVAFSPDGKLLASGSRDKTARLWDTATGKLLYTLTGSLYHINSVAFSPDGKSLVSGSGGSTRTGKNHEYMHNELRDATIRLWDTSTGKPLLTLSGDHNLVESMAFNPDGKTFACGSMDGTISLRNAANGTLARTLAGHTDPIEYARFSADGKNIIGEGSRNHQMDGMQRLIKRWDIVTGKLLPTLEGARHGYDAAAFSPDGKVTASSLNGVIKLWNTGTGTSLHTLTGKFEEVGAIYFSPDGKTLASTGSRLDGPVELWNTVTGKQLSTLTGQKDKIYSMVFSPDSRTLAIFGNPKAFGRPSNTKLWNLATRRPMRIMTGTFSGVSFSPDGKTLVSADDEKLYLRSVATGKVLLTFAEGNSITFSPDSKTLAVASGQYGSGIVKLWNASTGKLQCALTHSYGPVCFSPDGKTLDCQGENIAVKLWDVATGKLLHTAPGLTYNVTSVSFSPDGKTIACGCDDAIRLWDTATGEELARLYALDEDGWVAVTPDGRFDGNEAGLKNLHYVVGLEPIDLTQLKDRYYEPGLLSKLLGFNKEPMRNVAAFDHIDLYPEVKAPEAVAADGRLKMTLTNQGGGIGRVQVFVNGKELNADARGPKPDPEAKTADMTIDLSHAPGLIPGQPNTVKIVTWNQEGYLSSRGVECVYTPPGTADVAPPELWAIVVGVSDYAAPNLKLRYAAKDAESFASALALGAGDMLAGRVHVQLLTSDTAARGDAVTTVGFATRSSIARAFQSVQRHSRPQDLLVVFLAGHGVALSSGNSLYCYLTQDAVTGEPDRLTDAIRAADTVTSEDLAAWTGAAVMPPLKQVLVLDTCAAGAAKARLALRSDATDRTRAVERLKDRVGFWVLMGCTDSAVSYESPEYGQGLLTYSLLEYMHQGTLDDGQVDVSRLFQFAKDEVPRLMRAVDGGAQDPQIIAPQADSFPIGRLSRAEQSRIPLNQRRPVVLRPALVAEDTDLGLEDKLIDRLRDQEPTGARGDGPPLPAFVDAADQAGALQPRGSYTVSGTTIRVTLLLRRDGALIRKVELTGDQARPDDLLTKMLAAIDAAAETRVPVPTR